MILFQIAIKKYLSLLVLLLLSFSTYAQKGIAYHYEVEILNQDYINVRIFQLEKSSLPLVFKFPKQVPNFFLKESIQNEISDFYVFNKGKNKKITLLNGVYTLPKDFEYINYTVKFKDLEEEDFPIVNTFSKKNYSLLNFANFLGSFHDETVSLKVLKETQVVFQDTGTLNSFYSSPILLSCQNKKIDNKKINLEVFYNYPEKKILGYISEAINAFSLLGFEDKLENKKMIFIIDPKNENEAAIAHENCIVFSFKTVDKYQIQKTILHEMIHWVVPDLQSWLNESVAEFLSIKLLLKQGIISEDKFLQLMSRKIKEADKYKNYSLDDIFQNKTGLSKEENYQALYSKGATFAFILDAKFIELSDFKVSLEKYVLNGVTKNDEEIDFEFIQELIKFEKEYTIENKKFSYNTFLNHLGILFEENKLVEIKAQQNVLLKEVDDEVIIVANGDIENLEENDVVFKINGTKKIIKMREILMKKSEKNSCFVVLREGKRVKLKISNKESLFVREKFKLSFFEERTEEQIENWNKYNGKPSRNI